ncbi:Glycine cleavage system T protein (aminomethyltransferase) [Agreia bicolorata]|uniref:Glycine cleavage system T protein (Aminomethyltransferase) n=1 Tax=Agreia bicolorata TaxID=110935 RepID=A0A1T4XLN3_9MICO|nr:aminomethyltransferase family protein [Agreia bicolorata]SKA90470.1 Glycine cleavage system T protein (aminomethyltransferase) [Agreia bicolorata]
MPDNNEVSVPPGTPIGQIIFAPDSPIFEGSNVQTNIGFGWVPAEYSTTRDEFLASRETASIGFVLNNSPVYDVTGPEAAAFLNSVAVNKDFGPLETGASKHVVICNEQGYILADGVLLKLGENHFRTYWLAPVLDFFLTKSTLDVTGTWVLDEYFYQIDGPKSLEILEKVTGSDLHHLRFAQNATVSIAGAEAVVHRLGMSGALAYEVHGPSTVAREAYRQLRAAVEEVGGRPQGFWNYSLVNHTVAGYPNQVIHFLPPYRDSGPELAAYMESVIPFDIGVHGSASDDLSNAWVTPYDIGWGYLVNFDHEFPGKAALQAIASNRPRKVVTLEWNADDIGAAYSAQFRGADAVVYDRMSNDPVIAIADYAVGRMRIDYVLLNGEKIGLATGRTPAFVENRMISLAWLDVEHAAEGTEVTVLWGDIDHPKIEIRATVAQFPYYQGEFRNEKFDTSSIPRR